ncbi:MAG: zinc-ribbon domain-containing protein [Geobacteraceae bacterium]|nr:zinc-ribbon domain-containing protein [Geobacteraceae bacterium]
MIIQCEQCETTYRFDSARLQNGEARVRCIRCGNVFPVDSLSDLGEAFLNTQAPAKTRTSPNQGSGDSQYSATAPDAFADNTYAQPSDVSFDSPFEAPASQPDFSLDSPADQDQEEEDFWTNPAEFSLDTPGTERTSTPSPATSGAESEQTTDSDPNEFIFEPLEEDEKSAGTSEQAEDLPAQDLESDLPPGVSKKAKRKPKRKSSKLLLVVLLIILCGAGIYAYYFVTHGITSMPQLIDKAEEQINQLLNPQPDPAGPSISIRSGDNFYITNDHIGSLFVINGSVVNISDQPQGEIAIEATLYASDGKVLRSITSFCGNPISKEELRSEPWESLQERMNNKLGAGLSNVSVQPGESIPFSAVFHDLPDDFAEFSISEAEAPVASSTNK